MDDLTDRIDGVTKGLVLLAGHQQQTARRASQLAKSVQALARPLAKSRLVPGSGTSRALNAAHGGEESLAETAAKGAIAKGILRLFGPRGGKSLPYSKTLAARLLAEGKLTHHEHKVWKASNHVPDHVDVAS
jgi:hypothetical protein